MSQTRTSEGKTVKLKRLGFFRVSNFTQGPRFQDWNPVYIYPELPLASASFNSFNALSVVAVSPSRGKIFSTL